MQPIYLLLTSDDNYAMPMTVSLFSALSHLDRNMAAEVHIAEAGISPENQERCAAVARAAHPHTTLHWHNVNTDEFSGIHLGQYPPSVLIRLKVADIMPPECNRVLYLDSDIVIDDDISTLWNTDLGNYPLGAVENQPGGDFDFLIRDKFPELNAPADARYFNAGVMLINLEQWREMDLGRQALDFLNANSERVFLPDQDALNAVLSGNWKQLDLRWNAQIHSLDSHDHSIGITHYTLHKPWRRPYTGVRGNRFFAAYVKSGWTNPVSAWAWSVRLRSEQILRRSFERVLRKLGHPA